MSGEITPNIFQRENKGAYAEITSKGTALHHAITWTHSYRAELSRAKLQS